MENIKPELFKREIVKEYNAIQRDSADPRRFHFDRQEDETGVSGTGRVANGVVFPNGKAVVCWNTETSSVTVFDSLADVEKIHGHNGKTKVIWLDEE